MTRSGVVASVLLAFTLGTATGVICAQRTTLFSRRERAGIAQQGSPDAQSIHDLLRHLVRDSGSFVLTGVEDNSGRCNIGVTAAGLHDDYMGVRSSQGGPTWFVPYAAIYRIDREGPGPITVPVVYTTAFPRPKFCGD